MSDSGWLDGPIWMIGCGNMGGAMLRRWVASGLEPERFTIFTRGRADVPERVRSLHALPLEETPATLILAVKPQQLGDVVPMLSRISPTLLVSILAGVEISTLASRVPARFILRAMPNLPVAIGEGVTALHAYPPDAAVRSAGEALAAPLGIAEWIADEAQFDAVTALAGSGPGFVFRFADAMAQSGAALGLSSDQSLRLALATLAGAAAMAVSANESPARLAERVASSGGSTRRGLDVLDRNDALIALLTTAFAAAEQRNAEMAAEAR